MLITVHHHQQSFTIIQNHLQSNMFYVSYIHVQGPCVQGLHSMTCCIIHPLYLLFNVHKQIDRQTDRQGSSTVDIPSISHTYQMSIFHEYIPSRLGLGYLGYIYIQPICIRSFTGNWSKKQPWTRWASAALAHAGLTPLAVAGPESRAMASLQVAFNAFRASTNSGPVMRKAGDLKMFTLQIKFCGFGYRNIIYIHT